MEDEKMNDKGVIKRPSPFKNCKRHKHSYQNECLFCLREGYLKKMPPVVTK